MKQTVTAPPNTHGPAAEPTSTGNPPGTPVAIQAPEGIAAIVVLARILAAYGRHLAALLPQRELWLGFSLVARFLQAASMSGRLARIHRGIMRAVALERMLLRRAARGRDLKPLSPICFQASARSGARSSRGANPIPEPEAPYRTFPLPGTGRARTPTASPWDIGSEPSPQADPQSPAPQQTPPQPASNPPCSNDRQPVWLDTLPSMAELEQEVRRRPVGRTIAAICLDLGVSPRLCAGWFWNGLFQAMLDYRGNLIGVLRELRRRELQFEYESWKHPASPLPEQTPQAIRQMLGFFIGEPPVDPLRPAPSPYPASPDPASSGTGPP
jgi:hypothetical protein